MPGDEQRVAAQLVADAEAQEVELVLQRAGHKHQQTQQHGDQPRLQRGDGQGPFFQHAHHGAGARMSTAWP